MCYLFVKRVSIHLACASERIKCELRAAAHRPRSPIKNDGSTFSPTEQQPSDIKREIATKTECLSADFV